MPWANRSERILLTISEPQHCDYEICSLVEMVPIRPLKRFPFPKKVGKKAAHVKFSDLIYVREVPPAGSLALSARTIWWSREDYSRIRRDTKHVISKNVENRQPVSYRSSAVCTLGLETWIPTQKTKKPRHRSSFDGSRKSPIGRNQRSCILAELSRSFTRASATEAYLQADDRKDIEIPRTEENMEEHDFVEIRI